MQMISFHLFIHFIFFLLINFTQLPLASHACHEEERRALLDFKSSLEDPSHRLSSWQEGSEYQNCCNWHGIQCSRDTFHVISIDLRNVEGEIYFNQYMDSDGPDGLFESSPPKTALQGKFSPSVFNFTHLRYLDLAFNNFQESQIPLQFSNPNKLTHLDLSNSNFLGSTLTQFTNLSSLKYLDLSCIIGDCIHISTTKWLTGLVNLQVLRLSGIDLYEATSSNFAEHISFLSNLKDLDLSNCHVCGQAFPIQQFNNLSHLSSLDMSYNSEFSSPFPVYLPNLTSLSSLYLISCHLHGSVPYMPQLKELDVGQNTDLHVNLTRIFEHKWPKLKFLRMSYTKVNGKFLSLTSNVPLLETLRASHCSIQGSIPHSLCNISFLRDLRLESNNFTGMIPNCITMLRSLNQLDASNNSITGDVSLLSLFDALNLTNLDLSSNKLTIITDHHLYMYPKLKKLRLRSCNLKGLFPAFICNLTHLEELDLSQNNLTGIIPSCIYELNNLNSINLSHNSLQGPLPLPSQYAELYNLAHNKFDGEISMEMGRKLSTIRSVYLSDNELTGSVPSSMCSQEPGLHSNIQILDLSNNKMSGIIPTTIGYCDSLLSLNLGFNKFIGNVPKELGQATNLRLLQLNDNNLDGALHFISELYKLVVLNFGNNKFGGSISNVFSSLSDLKILSLKSNNFSGSISRDVIHLHQLQILDLSGNTLTGLIPREIGNLTMLTSRSNDTISLTGDWFGADVQLQMVSKGVMMLFEKLFAYSSGIDLSCNVLGGEIPEEIGLLKGLSMLNLSHNHLSGSIPPSVGSMNGLESLDLSFNKLSGHIPVTLASMDSLGYLNLSYNNLSGMVPRGPHIDTLSGDGSAYANNTFLCGYLTENSCEGSQSIGAGDANSLESEADGDDSEETWYFYGVVALGFIVGFWGLFFGLHLKKQTWWVGYRRVVDIVAFKLVEVFLKD